ncbi:MAG: hypothetical protein JKP90_07855 [Desulfofustis sp. PB-SRB1]|nr:hypothetical protein [Desulfofustis sp. PB-SRB1]
MLKNGAPIRHIQDEGHASLESTQIYTRVTINDLKRQIRASLYKTTTWISGPRPFELRTPPARHAAAKAAPRAVHLPPLRSRRHVAQ